MLKKIVLFIFILLLCSSASFAGKIKSKVSVTPSPPNLTATVKFTEPSGNNILDAEETGKLVVTVTNTGKGDAFDVKAELKADKKVPGLSFEKTTDLGTVPAGGKVAKEIELTAAEDIATSDLKFSVLVKEANGFDADPLAIAFRTKAFEPPKLIVADIGIDDQNGNSRVEPLENVELTARIQNMGHGNARNVAVDIVNGPNVFIGGDAVTRFDLGNIGAGQFKDVKFMFYTNKQIRNGEKIPVEIRISEARPQFASAKVLDLVMNSQQKSAQEIVVKGIESPKGEIAIAGGLSVDVDMNIPEGQKAGRDDVAVVIGNKNYTSSGVPSVQFADRDAIIMKEYLVKTLGFNPDNIIFSLDATLSKFNEIFGSRDNPQGMLHNYVKSGVSNVFIYYAGHGAPDLKSQEAYFVPVDANPQYIASNGYRLQTFYDNLAKVSAKKITIVLDSCFSGNSGDKKLLFKDISPTLVKVKKAYRGPANSTVITSADMDQVSSWYPEKRHSLFTYYFLKALQGDADANKDKKVTVAEVKSYLKENVSYTARRLNGVEQNPMITGDDNEVLVRLSK